MYREEKEHKLWDIEAQIAQIFATIPYPATQLGGGGANISSTTKFVFKIAGEGWKRKFWNFKAQIAEIKHKFLTLCPTSYLTWGAIISSAPINDMLIAKSGEKHKF